MAEKPVLRPDPAVGPVLRDAAAAILAEARTAIDDRAKPVADAVHAFRRAMKRWRSLLRLLGPFLGEEGRQLKAEARDLARALGRSRDPQSALDALADLSKHGLVLSERSLATVRGRLEMIRRAAERAALSAGMRDRLTAALDRAAAAVDRWPLDALTFTTIARRLARGYRAARRAAPEEWDMATPKQLHRLRKHIVDHRSQMEIVKPVWPDEDETQAKEAHRLRTQLGKHQDLTVLVHFTDPHKPLARWRARLAAPIAELRAKHAKAARRDAVRLLGEKPKVLRRRLENTWKKSRRLPR